MEQIIGCVSRGNAPSACQALRVLATKVDLSDDEYAYLRACCVRADIYLARKPALIEAEVSVRICAENGTELNHGTLDVLYGWGETIILQDFKFGWVPVKHARENLQGMNYALGVFQKYRDVQKVGVELIQPKLGWVSMTFYRRTQMAQLFQEIAEVIRRAELVQNNPEIAQRFMKPGTYCSYCALSGSCTALSNHRALAATKFNNLPMPSSFKGLEITDPVDMALARYWVDIIENGCKEIKQRAFEIAELNGGEISCTLPNGEEIIYAVTEKMADRTLGAPVEVFEALKEFMTLEEVMGAAELAITKLEPIAKTARVEAARLAGEKLTKKAAWEAIQNTLEAHGVLSRPDTKIRFLKRKKQAPKELEQTPLKQIENQQIKEKV
jgi:hypothetical protein